MLRPLLYLAMLATVVRGASVYTPADVAVPSPSREFRGAWVASVSNIDWPSKPGLPTDQQKAELLAILNRAQNLKLNVVVLQIRPACDALYPSRIEPWSEYLTGTMGKAPQPFWDPLEFAIAEAHGRGIELHAWFNPFRARHPSAFSPVARGHVSKTRPALVKSYGTHLWLDPGLQQVHDYSMSVIMDVVQRYDVDGIHLDDYFYPYREKDKTREHNLIPFPDWTSWNSYVKAGGKLEKEDWRRDNVNRFVARMYREVKQVKPWVKVGVSPFGIYRPGFPEQIKGFDQFASIYADPRTWLRSGWVDYLAPQLYWRIEPREQSFPVLLKWWTDNNPKQRLVVAGLNTTAAGSARTRTNGWPAGEIRHQIEITRETPGASGHIHWNMTALLKNQGGVIDDLAKTVYREAALVPAIAGESTSVPAPGRMTAQTGKRGTRVEWSAKDQDARFWLIQTRDASGWQSTLLPAKRTAIDLAAEPQVIAVRAVNRFGTAGPAAVVKR